MLNNSQKNQRNKLRAARACQRCSQRKVRCDATENGTPCSRCRLDAAPTCTLTPSRRGLYARKKSRATSSSRDTPPVHYSRSGDALDGETQSTSIFTDHPPPTELVRTVSGTSKVPAGRVYEDSNTGPRESVSSCTSTYMADVASQITNPHDTARPLSDSTRNSASETVSNSRDSLAAMFENFIEKQGHAHDGAVPKVGVVFFSGSSPFTFALEELQRPEQAGLYDPGLCNKDNPLQRNTHPSHMTAHGLAWLKSNDAFDSPSRDVSEALVSAFIDRFYPLYSIVDRESFLQLHEQQNLPWILLHAVCFLGATFCDASVVHKAGFKSRWHMRRFYYDKAKVLFDVGYETNRVTLLQTVLILSFWGPQMQSYWNPCSWIGFGVTIAESLGINQDNPSAHLDARAKGLLRRLWWTLALRDAYCAALLGRPFRINISQCDTEMLKLSDFNHSSSCTGEDSENDCHPQYLYQVESVKLSLILRKVVELRFGPSTSLTTVDELHKLLDKWQAELPRELDWSQNGTPNKVLSSSLRIIFNHHLIFMHIGKPSTTDDLGTRVDLESSSFKIAESAAQSISTTALTLMTSSMVGLMPHEIFPGFFIAGIVFYRRFRQTQDGFAQLYRAAMDNCQMVMNEARERWDPAVWAMKIFDFLLSGTSSAKAVVPTVEWDTQVEVQDGPQTQYQQADQGSTAALSFPDYSALHSINFDSPRFLDASNQFNDILLMPNYFGATPDAWFRDDISYG